MGALGFWGDYTSINDDKKLKGKIAKLEELRDLALDLEIIFVRTEDEDNAYFVFETLNTRGKDLSVADLVKNLVMRRSPAGNAGVDLTRDKWKAIQDLFEQSHAKIRIESFLHHFWLSRKDFVSQKKLFKAMKEGIPASSNSEFLDNLSNDSKYYRIINEPSYQKRWTVEQIEVKRSLDAINMTRVGSSTPFILAVFREWKNGGLRLRDVKQYLHAIESFHLINSVSEQRATGGLNQMFAMHARSLATAVEKKDKRATCLELLEKLKLKIPDQKSFEFHFALLKFARYETTSKNLIRHILVRIQEHTGGSVDRDLATIEHIAPQSTTSIQRRFEIGNLIIAPENLNSQKLKDKDFTEKRRILEKAGIVLDNALKTAEEWKSKDISSRTKLLAKIAYEEVWRF